eukprot:353848-Chlamydomonas_euryale.AAC.1
MPQSCRMCSPPPYTCTHAHSVRPPLSNPACSCAENAAIGAYCAVPLPSFRTHATAALGPQLHKPQHVRCHGCGTAQRSHAPRPACADAARPKPPVAPCLIPPPRPAAGPEASDAERPIIAARRGWPPTAVNGSAGSAWAPCALRFAASPALDRHALFRFPPCRNPLPGASAPACPPLADRPFQLRN